MGPECPPPDPADPAVTELEADGGPHLLDEAKGSSSSLDDGGPLAEFACKLLVDPPDTFGTPALASELPEPLRQS